MWSPWTRRTPANAENTYTLTMFCAVIRIHLCNAEPGHRNRRTGYCKALVDPAHCATKTHSCPLATVRSQSFTRWSCSLAYRQQPAQVSSYAQSCRAGDLQNLDTVSEHQPFTQASPGRASEVAAARTAIKLASQLCNVSAQTAPPRHLVTGMVAFHDSVLIVLSCAFCGRGLSFSSKPSASSISVPRNWLQSQPWVRRLYASLKNVHTSCKL